MKVVNFFTQVFTIFAFLTLGSLLIIFGVHLLSLENVLFKIQELYGSPWKCIQTIMLGMMFIAVGLAFTKNIVKKSKMDAIILQSEIGPIVIAATAIEDVSRKVLKHFHLVKESKVQSTIRGNKQIEVLIKLVLWSGGKTQELLNEIQEECSSRLRKLVGKDAAIEITCDVQRIEDHESSLEPLEIAERIVS